jgi:hypothetical protein
LGARGKFRAIVRNDMFIGYARYIHRLSDKYTSTYIRQLTNECTSLCSSFEARFLSSSTEEYITVIFLVTKEYKSTEERTLFFVVAFK